MLLYLFYIITWFVAGFCFAFALIHHTKMFSGRETQRYLREVKQENTFNSRRYAMTKGDIIVSLWLSVLGPVCLAMFLLKCISDAIVTVIRIVSIDKTVID